MIRTNPRAKGVRTVPTAFLRSATAETKIDRNVVPTFTQLSRDNGGVYTDIKERRWVFVEAVDKLPEQAQLLASGYPDGVRAHCRMPKVLVESSSLPYVDEVVEVNSKKKKKTGNNNKQFKVMHVEQTANKHQNAECVTVVKLV